MSLSHYDQIKADSFRLSWSAPEPRLLRSHLIKQPELIRNTSQGVIKASVEFKEFGRQRALSKRFCHKMGFKAHPYALVEVLSTRPKSRTTYRPMATDNKLKINKSDLLSRSGVAFRLIGVAYFSHLEITHVYCTLLLYRSTSRSTGSDPHDCL